MRYWIVTEDVDGLYIRDSAYLLEDFDMRNESRSNLPGVEEVRRKNETRSKSGSRGGR